MIGKLSSQQGEDGKRGEEGDPSQQVTENPAGNHQQEKAFDQPQKPPQQFVEQVKPRQFGHQIQSVAENEPEDQNAEETGQKQQRPGQKPSCRSSQLGTSRLLPVLCCLGQLILEGLGEAMKQIYICEDTITGIYSALHDAWKECRDTQAAEEGQQNGQQ